MKGRSGGRNARTTDELKRSGTFRPDRHAGIENPEPPVGEPVPPKVLTGDALAEWERTVERLRASKTLSPVDASAIYQYVCLFAETEQLAVTQSETAASIERLEDNLSGLEGADLVACFQEITKLRQLESRYTSQIQGGRMKIRAYLVEFGLTPAARSRVKVAGGNQETEAPKPTSFAALQQQARSLRAVN